MRPGVRSLLMRMEHISWLVFYHLVSASATRGLVTVVSGGYTSLNKIKNASTCLVLMACLTEIDVSEVVLSIVSVVS